MSAKLWLRIASGIALVFAAGHSLGGLSHWSPMGNNAVLARMGTVYFQVMGVRRTYLDFFMGFGWSLSIGMLLQAALMWQIGSLAERDPAAARPMIALLILNGLTSIAITAVWLIPVPALFATLLLIPLLLALRQTIKLKRTDVHDRFSRD